MALRIQFENNDDIGVFTKLTNSYCLVAIGGAENFYRLVETNKSDNCKLLDSSSPFFLAFLRLNWLKPFQLCMPR